MVASSLDDTHPIKCLFTGASVPGSQALLGNQKIASSSLLCSES